MNKTILKQFTGKNNKPGGDMVCREELTVDVVNLLQEMKGILKEAATELLQPRPEAIANILKQAKH
jgi:hypothetical protein